MPVTLIIIVVSLALVYLLVLRQKREKSGSWLQFYAQAKEAGFSFKEAETLRRLIEANADTDDPSSMFWSQNQLDLCIKSLVRTVRPGGTPDPEEQDFLAKLYEYRKKLEMDKPRAKNGLQDSRQIEEEQQLRVLVEGTGLFRSTVIKNTPQYITISRPVSIHKVPADFSWHNMRISVYFWRDEDAGYVFDTDVLDEVFSKGHSSLKIAHGENLMRTQKRRSIRVKLHKPAFLYLVVVEEAPNKLEDAPGLKCFMEDLSDTGCAVTIGGKAVEGLRVKVQFSLGGRAVVMAGTVRSTEFKEDQNRSLLHIEADPLPLETRNHILGQVFGMLPDEEEDLPFRVLDDIVKQPNLPPLPEGVASQPPPAPESIAASKEIAGVP